MPKFIEKVVAEKIAKSAIESCMGGMLYHATKKYPMYVKYVHGLAELMCNSGKITAEGLGYLIFDSQFSGNFAPMYAFNIEAIFHVVNKNGDFNGYMDAMKNYVAYVNKSAKELYPNADELTTEFCN